MWIFLPGKTILPWEKKIRKNDFAFAPPPPPPPEKESSYDPAPILLN